MTEQVTTRPRHDRGPGPGGLLGVAAAGGSGEMVVVSSGLFHDRLPVAGLTVAEVRDRFADRLDIDPSATPVIDGEPVDDENVVVRPGQTLSFFQYAGEKGSAERSPDERA